MEGTEAVLEKLYENLDKLREGDFYGSVYRGVEPTGVEIYFRSLELGIQLSGIDLEGIPSQLWLGPRHVRRLDPETDKWTEIEEAPLLKAFLLLDPRVYKGRLEEVEPLEQVLAGRFVLRAYYYPSKLQAFDGKELLPEKFTGWLKDRWGQEKRRVSFLITENQVG